MIGIFRNSIYVVLKFIPNVLASTPPKCSRRVEFDAAKPPSKRPAAFDFFLASLHATQSRCEQRRAAEEGRARLVTSRCLTPRLSLVQGTD